MIASDSLDGQCSIQSRVKSFSLEVQLTDLLVHCDSILVGDQNALSFECLGRACERCLLNQRHVVVRISRRRPQTSNVHLLRGS